MAESFVRKLPICNTLDPATVASINKICVFSMNRSDDTSCIYITEDDDVFSMGENIDGCLGLGDERSRAEPVAIEQLCKQHVKSIAFGRGGHMLAVTECGRLFSWGNNGYGQLGNGNWKKVLIPVQVTTNLQDKKIVQAVCGQHHSMALSDEGEIFAWGDNGWGQLGSGLTGNQYSPHRVSLGKAVSIACGYDYSMALLGSGEVYGWGFNLFGQLGLGNAYQQQTPCKVEALSGVAIKQIVCGGFYTLALSEDGSVFSWGENQGGQLGTGDKTELLSPHKIPSKERFIEVAACHWSRTSAGLTVAGKVFMWGKCDGRKVTSPLLTEASTTDEIFALFSDEEITWRIYSVAEAAGRTFIYTSDIIAKSFDDSTTTDIKFIAEGREIYCHKAILKIRCEHFRSMFQSHLDENNKVFIEVPYPYDVYRAFLYFLYTDSVDLCQEGAIGLLELANGYCEQILRNKCEQIIKKGITVENTAMLYATAIKFGAKELEDFCLKFALDNMTEVTRTQSFAQLDESTRKIFCLEMDRTTSNLSVYVSAMKLTKTEAAGRTFTSDIAKSFDDSTTTDITFIAEGRKICCHKAILKIRCEHFSSMFQSHWDEANKDSIEVPYPYRVYRAFLYFLYTDSVDLYPEGALGLLELANCYCEPILKNKCEQIITQSIDVENAAMLYAAAIKFGAKELEHFCFKFAVDNMTAVTRTESFIQLDESTRTNFILKTNDLTGKQATKMSQYKQSTEKRETFRKQYYVSQDFKKRGKTCIIS